MSNPSIDYQCSKVATSDSLVGNITSDDANSDIINRKENKGSKPEWRIWWKPKTESWSLDVVFTIDVDCPVEISNEV